VRVPDLQVFLTANLHDADDSATVTLLGYSASVLARHFYSSSRGLSQGYDGGITDGGSVTVVGWLVVVVMVAGAGNIDIKYLAAPAPGKVDSSGS